MNKKAVNEVSVLEETKLLPVVINSFEEDAGSGFDNMSAQDYAIPFISILQSLSPQLKKSSGIQGAVVGGIYNTVTHEVMDGDNGVVVIPCAYEKKWVEWKPRDVGGGFVKNHTSDTIMLSTSPNGIGKDVLPNGNEIIPTAYYYVLVLKEGQAPQTAVISMTRTQIKKSKKWNSIMSGIRLLGKNGPYTPPMFSHKYKMVTVEEEKNGFSWYGWDITNAGKVTDKNEYDLAKKINSEVGKGALTAKPVEEGSESGIDTASEVM